MAHANDINRYVRNSQNGIKSALCKLYKSRLDTKLARTYTDDIDVNHRGMPSFRQSYRPGQRDDINPCSYMSLMHVL